MEKPTLVVLLVICMMVHLSFWTPCAHAHRGALGGPLIKDQIRQSFVIYHEKIFDIIESVFKEDKQLNKNLPAFYAIKKKTLFFMNQTAENFVVSVYKSLRYVVGGIRSWWDSAAIPLLTGQYDPEELKEETDKLLALVENFITFYVLGEETPQEKSESKNY